MYTRAKVEVINLITGATVATIEPNTPVKVASATEWHGIPYFITEWATEKKQPNGIRVLDLDLKQIDPEQPPVPPVVSNDDLIKETNKIVKMIWEAIKKIAAQLGINL